MVSIKELERELAREKSKSQGKIEMAKIGRRRKFLKAEIAREKFKRKHEGLIRFGRGAKLAFKAAAKKMKENQKAEAKKPNKKYSNEIEDAFNVVP